MQPGVISQVCFKFVSWYRWPKSKFNHHAHKTVTYVVWTNQFDVGNLGKSRTLTLGCSYLFELHDVYFTEFCSTRGPKELLSTWKNSSFGLHDKPDWFCYSSNNQIYSYCYKQSSVWWKKNSELYIILSKQHGILPLKVLAN